MTPDRRRAFLVRLRPLPTFRVRSASGEPAHLVVLQLDGSLVCNCTAASFRATCSHVRITIRSIERRTGYHRQPNGTWSAPLSRAGVGVARRLIVLHGGRGDDVDAAWEAAS